MINKFSTQWTKKKKKKKKNNICSLITPPSKEVIDQLIAEMIIFDLQPYKMVEDYGFQRMIEKSYPKYILPGRKYFVSYIDKLYSEKSAKLEEHLKTIEYCAISTDIWTGGNNEPYITFTCHYIHNGKYYEVVLDTIAFTASHTGDNINILLNTILTKYGIKNKVVAVVTDNARNMINAVDYSFVSQKCAAHTIQLAVKDTLEEMVDQNLLSKCRSTVTHFRRSPKATNDLKAIQAKLKLKSHKLKQDVATRWNSTFYMIERLIEQKEAIIKYTMSPDSNLDDISSSEWKYLEGLIEILRPIESITKCLEGEKYCTASLVVPQITSAIVNLKLLKFTNKQLKDLRDSMVNNLKER